MIVADNLVGSHRAKPKKFLQKKSCLLLNNDNKFYYKLYLTILIQFLTKNCNKSFF